MLHLYQTMNLNLLQLGDMIRDILTTLNLVHIIFNLINETSWYFFTFAINSFAINSFVINTFFINTFAINSFVINIFYPFRVLKLFTINYLQKIYVIYFYQKPIYNGLTTVYIVLGMYCMYLYCDLLLLYKQQIFLSSIMTYF